VNVTVSPWLFFVAFFILSGASGCLFSSSTWMAELRSRACPGSFANAVPLLSFSFDLDHAVELISPASARATQ
jgi:hypothetical protein